MDKISDLLQRIAQTGKDHPEYPPLKEVEAFAHFFAPDGTLDYGNLDKRDGACTRRELLLRFLLLCAVIDQGPDIVGVRRLLLDVTNSLYRKEIRFLHKPVDFFKELGISIDEILEKHQNVKDLRAEAWAKENEVKSSEKYHLFMDNSKQVLNFAVFRWGVPLALPLLLEHDCKDEDKKTSVLVDYLESWPSAETMSQQIKDHERYGLGKAIGDKASHLFAKWMVSSFCLSRRKDSGWSKFSFEVPYDSNAGRILWRTGFLLKMASEKDYIKEEVVQPGKGKQGLNYIRVTNIRGMSSTIDIPLNIQEKYVEIATQHLKTHKKIPRKIEIQRVQHAYLLTNFPRSGLDIADFDEGLIFIGRTFCFNHANPLCATCPLGDVCEAHLSDKNLIDSYRT